MANVITADQLHSVNRPELITAMIRCVNVCLDLNKLRIVLTTERFVVLMEIYLDSTALEHF